MKVVVIRDGHGYVREDQVQSFHVKEEPTMVEVEIIRNDGTTEVYEILPDMMPAHVEVFDGPNGWSRCFGQTWHAAAPNEKPYRRKGA